MAHCALPTSAKRSSSSAGWRSGAITARWCSSICAIASGVTQIVFDRGRFRGSSRGRERAAPRVGGRHPRHGAHSRGEQFSKKEGKLVSAANANIPTGEIEISVLESSVFNKAETPPFAIG